MPTMNHTLRLLRLATLFCLITAVAQAQLSTCTFSTTINDPTTGRGMRGVKFFVEVHSAVVSGQFIQPARLNFETDQLGKVRFSIVRGATVTISANHPSFKTPQTIVVPAQATYDLAALADLAAGTISPSFTNGSVLFIDNSVVSQDNASFSFDNATNSLKVTRVGLGVTPISTAALYTTGIIGQNIGAADFTTPPNLVGAQTVKLGSSAIINDSTSGDYRQISAHVTQQGTRNVVAGSFGARCDGVAQCWGINPWGYANVSGSTGLAIETNFGVLASGGLSYGQVYVVVGNFASNAFVQMQSGASGISAANGIVINKGGTGLDPITGSIITTAGGPSMTNGIDLSGGQFSGAPIKLANNSFIKALNSAAASKILMGLDGSDYTVIQSGGTGIRFPNAANAVNLMLIADTGGATVTGGLSVLNNSSVAIFGVSEANGITNHREGANVASASTITPTGNIFHVTGTTNIDAISTTGITAGTTITLIFDGILIVGDAGNLKLASAFTTSADDSLTLVWDGSNWIEVSRSVN